LKICGPCFLKTRDRKSENAEPKTLLEHSRKFLTLMQTIYSFLDFSGFQSKDF